MSDIQLSNLSNGVYDQSVKYAKEGTLTKNIDKIVSLSAKDGINKDEKSFLAGLASEKNIQTLKDSDNSIKNLSFLDIPNEDADIKKNNKTNSNNGSIISSIKNSILGKFESSQDYSNEEKNTFKINRNISYAEKFGKDNFDNLLKLPENERVHFNFVYDLIDKESQKDLLHLLKNNSSLLTNKDSKNFSFTKNLDSLISTGIDGNKLAKEVIKTLKDNKNILQANYGNLNVSSLKGKENQQPSELLRMIKDLAEK